MAHAHIKQVCHIYKMTVWRGSESNGQVFRKRFVGKPLINHSRVPYDEEGYEEGSDGYTKYGSWYGLANADWCVMFISWCANQAGIMTTSSTGTVPNVPKMASTSAMYTWYTNNRRNLAPSMSASSPNRLQVGDIVVINTQNGGPVTDHVGIVVSVDYDAGTADVMEGNRSNKVKKVTYTNLVDSIGYTIVYLCSNHTSY